MLFNIAPQNAEKAKKAFTTAKPAHVYGYTKAAILTPKNRRMSFYYEIDIIQDIIVCTIRHKETDTMEAVAVFRSFTPESIEIEKADLYRNCSNYPYRTETADRYMRKYDQIACIVHGAIAAGLLYDTQEATTSAETIEDKENTTKDENRPQEATETTTEPTMYKYGMRLRGYSIGAQPAGAVAREDDHTGQFYDIISYNAPLSQEDIKHYSLTPLEAATTAATTPDGETTTGTKKAPQDATSDTTTGPETSTATQDTTESDTRPPRATEDATPGNAAGSSITPGTAAEVITGTKSHYTSPPEPGHACENAPGRTETPQAVPTTAPPNKRPPRGKTRAAPGRPPGKQRNFCFFGLTEKNRSEKSKLST